MRHRFAISLTVLSGLLAGATAQAGIVFSNVTINGTLAGGASFVTDADSIDFSFPNASVGDNLPSRSGTLQVTFEALSDVALSQDQLDLLGAVSGSGTIFINEVIEDLAGPTIIATLGDAIDEPSDLPYHADLNFASAATHIKVKKSFYLTASDTAGLDVASIGQMNQTIVPEPATLALLSLGGLVAGWARRRA